jgi:hypothetical protein
VVDNRSIRLCMSSRVGLAAWLASSYPASIRAYDGPLKVASQQHGSTAGSTTVVTIECRVAVIGAISDQQDGVLAWLPFRMPC